MERRDVEADLVRLHPEGFAWAVRCCRGDRDEAEDVLQQAYLKVLEGRARFDGRSSFRTWLFGVIRWTARESGRRWRAQAARLGRWWRETGGMDGVSPEDGVPDERARLERALRRLSTRQSEVLHLVFYQEMTIEEAASVLRMRLGTARTHYQRGKERLRALLSEAR